MKETLPELSLLTELSTLIEQTRSAVVSQANYALTLLFWQIGRRVNEEILQNQRADYGKRIIGSAGTAGAAAAPPGTRGT
jgi:hypothetical protein